MSLKIAFHYLVEKLREVKSLKTLKILDEGALMVSLFQLDFEENIIVYLLAGELSLEFIKKSVNINTRAEIHTLFIVSRDLVPDDGTRCQPEGSLRLLLDLYDGKVYTYRVIGTAVEIFPVAISQDGLVTYGQPVNTTNIHSAYVAVNSNYIRGVRKVAEFGAYKFHQQHNQNRKSPRRPSPPNPLKPFYDLLDIPVTATAAEIKIAYRRKARLHHPDADQSPDATAKMQRINEAYEQIMRRFE